MEKESKKFPPYKVLLFLTLVFAMLGAIAFFIPEEGVRVAGKDFYFVSLQDALGNNEDEKIDVEALIQARKDSLQAHLDQLRDAHYQSVQDSIDAAAALAKADPTRLQYGNEERDGLDAFFNALATIGSNDQGVRILHYGDSQIEEDRITSFVRKKLQARFGGGGVGMLVPRAITHSQTIYQSASENWTRYTAFGGKGPFAEDGRYGALAVMCKYNNYMADSLDSILVEKTFSSGYVSYSPRKNTHATVRNFNRVRVFMGHNSAPVELVLSFDGQELSRQIEANTSLQIVSFDFEKAPSSVTVSFRGAASPEVYGISLETPTGIHMDNISMRGGSGTIFYKLNGQLTKQMYDALHPKLIILQFGGNVMPYVDTKKKAENFGKEFLRNMKRIKSLCPEASLLVIGPSDMSKNINGKMQTYPNLPDVRDALKEAAFEVGGAYFDMYEVMGGKNSMLSWVDSDPPLAAKDYIHFSPRGASKIAEIFYESLMLDYEHYLNRQKGKKKEK